MPAHGGDGASNAHRRVDCVGAFSPSSLIGALAAATVEKHGSGATAQ